MFKLVVNANDKKSIINKNIYGHFSEHLGRCIYEGLYVGENSDIPNVNGMRTDVVNALKNIKVPVLRWPGGCFADEYHWKDGVGPKENRKRMINTHWGGVVEDNSFGTHEFMELCEQIGCEPYINGNVGSGTVQEMSEWVEYMTFGGVSPMAEWRAKNGRKEPWKLKYIAVGNENWGCGGNMRPEYYADEYRRYQTYLRSYDGNRLYKIACGPSSGDYNWTEKFMQLAARYCDAISLHHYTFPGGWNDKGSAIGFDEAKYYKTLSEAYKMEELITRHLEIMNKYDPKKRVDLIVDEWGTWFDVEEGTNPGFLYQQSTMRDAMVCAMSFDIFNAHCDRVTMANIAQTVNVLQAVVLTEGNKMLLTPTYHVFDLYKNHHDATLLGYWLETEKIGGEYELPNLSATASEKDGVVTLTVTNLSMTDSAEVDCTVLGLDAKNISGRILTAEVHAHNTFDAPNNVAIKPFDIKGLKFELPACSVVEITLK